MSMLAMQQMSASKSSTTQMRSSAVITFLPNLTTYGCSKMIRIVIGVALGGTVAMIFPEQAAIVYEFIRGSIHEGANVVADQTNG